MTTDEEFHELISVAFVKVPDEQALMLNVVTGEGKVLNLVMAGAGLGVLAKAIDDFRKAHPEIETWPVDQGN